jgi:cytochrome c553
MPSFIAPMIARRMLVALICVLCAVALRAVSAQEPASKPVPRGDPAAGKRKTAGCNGCHAVAGMKNVPSLGGQGTGYFIAAMHAYRDGTRNHTTMRDVAGQFSERELVDLAAHYADTTASADGTAPGAAPDSSTQCAVCHGAGGAQGATLDVPRLAGQKAAYLELALRAYRSSARKQPIMQQQAAALSDEQIAELAAYYASRPGLTVK